MKKFSFTFCIRLNLYHRQGVIENNCMNFYIGSINKNADSVNNNSHFFLIHYFCVKSQNLKWSVGIYIRITGKKRIKQAMIPIASYIIIDLFLFFICLFQIVLLSECFFCLYNSLHVIIMCSVLSVL